MPFTDRQVSDDIVRELQAAIVPPVAVVQAPRVSVEPEEFYVQRSVIASPPRQKKFWFGLLSLLPWLIGAGIVVGGLLYISGYGLRMKGEVIQQGSAAVSHMVAASDQLERFNWTGAHERFELARAGFSDAGSQLGIFGPALTGFLAKIPGLGELHTDQELLSAGKLLAEAGSALSDAISPLASTTTVRTGKDVAIIPIDRLTAFSAALAIAGPKITDAQKLLADIKPENIPQDMRDQFASFTSKLPQMKFLVSDSEDAIAFLKKFSGDDRPRRYLILFQNSSELRPTGGFPGTYGLLTLSHGVITDWRADDIYNPDGQMHDLIIPPVQLQHITPGWGMRDANWFVDFPMSARHVMDFWQRDGGAAVDGVLTIRPDVLASVLKTIGPVALESYDTVLTSDNVLTTLQQEVETNRSTGKPKQVIADLAPVVLNKMAALPADKWFALLDTFRGFLDRRDILAYFTDTSLQSYVNQKGWSGQVLKTDGDYLMTVVSNIKGAKADAVTDTSLKLEARMEAGTLVHRLTITRQHNGGKTPYGFYNATNRSYVRVLVPQGSVLRGVSGNDRPGNRALMTYAGTAAIHDSDLLAIEAAAHYDARWDATTSVESGKTEFGFWMKVDPGATQVVQIEYAVPAEASGSPYRLLIQRQPGLDLADLEVALDKAAFSVTSATPALTEWPDSWRLHTTLDRDLQLEVKVQ